MQPNKLYILPWHKSRKFIYYLSDQPNAISILYDMPLAANRIPSCTATASSTHGSLKNSLLLNSSVRTVAPSLGPLPSTHSRSRDCDSSQVCMNCTGSFANDSRNVRLR